MSELVAFVDDHGQCPSCGQGLGNPHRHAWIHGSSLLGALLFAVLIAAIYDLARQ